MAHLSFCRPLFKKFYTAFLCFDTEDNATRAIEEFRFPEFVPGKMSRAINYRNRTVETMKPAHRSVFVKGFGKASWTHKGLFQKFTKFGRILSCRVGTGLNSEFLGFGYVIFSTIDDAQKAINEVS